MSTTCRQIFAFAAALAGIAIQIGGVIAADDAAKTFQQAKHSIQTQLRSKQATDRIQAYYQLKRYHELDAARLVLQLGLRDASPEVRVAAYETLRSYADDPDICNLLLASLRKSAKTREGGQGADVVLAALLATPDEATSKDITTFLDKQLATAPSGPAIVSLTADNLGLHGKAEDLPSLQKLTTTRLFADNFAVRRAVVRAIMRIREPATIGQLIGLLGALKGEVRGDIVQYLAEITQQEHGLDAAAWKTWWAGAKETFTFPPLARGLMSPVKAPGGIRASYYGLPLFARRLVFVFDTSGSMAGPRLDAAKRELMNAISKLPEETAFGIVVFNSRVDAWQKQLVAATPNNKDSALRFMGGLLAREQTGTYDALATAFSYDAEALYLLTDGAPTTGKFIQPGEIITAITHGNLARRLTIHTIGIGVGPEGGPFDEFLRELARNNYGQYQRVDH